MKFLFVVFSVLFSLACYSDSVLVDRDSWIKDKPKGKNLVKVRKGMTLGLVSPQNAGGYVNVSHGSISGWIYGARVSILKDFPEKDCGSFSPFGYPQSSISVTLICRNDYTIGFDESGKIPLWVAYKVSVETAHTGNVDRSEHFFLDGKINPDNQANGDDYARSGYDKGHMAGSASLDAHRLMNDSTYVYTNMAPQLPGFNRDMMGYKGVWGKLESVIRRMAYEKDLYVISGSFYTGTSKRIGRGVVVPDAFYKVVFDANGEFLGAFWTEHKAGGSEHWQSASTSINAIEEKTGLDLFPNIPSDHGVESFVVKF